MSVDASPAVVRSEPEGGAPRTRTRLRWLLLVHQVPASPSNLRVRTWRRLQQLGAIPVKQAVYVLPDSPESREDFAWLTADIAAAGGEAVMFAADGVDGWTDDHLIDQFTRARQEDYAALSAEVDALVVRVTRATRRAAERSPAARRRVHALRQRLEAIERIDFFDAAGRDRVVEGLRRLEDAVRPRPTTSAGPPGGPAGRTPPRDAVWVTRPRPGVDRMASAWLIRRFIDPDARFGFAESRETVHAGGIAFDMAGVEFGHHGDRCTFETLSVLFELTVPELARIAAIVHDLDLKDERFGPPEAPTIGALVEGLRLAHDDDHELLERGIAMFEALYRSFQRAARAGRPRRVASSARSGAPRNAGAPRRKRPS